MDYPPKQWKWSLSLNVYHGTGYGHGLELAEMSGQWTVRKTDLGKWSTYGMPGMLLNDARAAWDARFTEHCLNVYGIQEEIPRLWTGEEGPF